MRQENRVVRAWLQPKNGPKSSQDRPKGSQAASISPRWPKMALRCTQDAPERHQDVENKPPDSKPANLLVCEVQSRPILVCPKLP